MNSSVWKIAHASVTGTSHLARGTECQDRFDSQVLETLEGKVMVVVLADGAGSSELSQVGAELACRLFIQQIAVHFESEGKLTDLNRNFGVLWLEYFRQKIGEQAAEEDKLVRKYACTFLAAVIGESGAVFYQVGDGAIVCSLSGEAESYFFPIAPAKKIYANATNFITNESAEKYLVYDYIPEAIEDLAMFTDGVESFAVNFQTEMPHEPFLRPMLAPLRKADQTNTNINDNLAEFLDSPRINDKTDDDKTLFLASRHVPPSPPLSGEMPDARADDQQHCSEVSNAVTTSADNVAPIIIADNSEYPDSDEFVAPPAASESGESANGISEENQRRRFES